MDFGKGCFVGRIWDKNKAGPCLVTIRNEHVYDITSPNIPTMRDLLELNDVKGYLDRNIGEKMIKIAHLGAYDGNIGDNIALLNAKIGRAHV
jgi:fumarylacetoacetate (FAA) hydrolase family protein